MVLIALTRGQTLPLYNVAKKLNYKIMKAKLTKDEVKQMFNFYLNEIDGDFFDVEVTELVSGFKFEIIDLIDPIEQ